jgi:D-sedoheptulose 7-phosphate isomerase
VKALGRPGDVAFAISPSGNSKNVLKGIEACRQKEVVTIGFTGGDGGALAGAVDHLLCVSSTAVVSRIQETHILIGHIICEMIDVRLFGQSASP